MSGHKYTVAYAQDGDGWTAECREVGINVVAHGRTLRTVRQRMRRALAIAIGQGAMADSQMVERYLIPGSTGLVEQALKARAEANEAAARAQNLTAEAARALSKAGVKLRDSGEILRLSYGRVHQLLTR